MSEELYEKVEAREEIKRNLPTRQPINLDWAALKDNSFNQIGNTLKFNPYLFSKALLQQELFLTFSDNESLYKYEKNTGLWHNGTDPYIKEIAGEVLKTEITTHTLNECLTNIKVQTYINRKETEEKQKGFLPFNNGVYNTNTKELQPYQPNLYFTTKIPVNYNPEATCPKIDAFFSEIVNPEDLQILYEIFAFCLMDGYDIQTAILLIGSGSNGKSTYLRILTKFIGKENTSNIPLQALDPNKNRFACAALHNKYANICADLPNQALRSTGIFKMITGGDSLYAEGKFKDGFSFVNRAKLIFSANEAPALYEDTDAIYRRFLLIVFPNQFVGSNDKKSLFSLLSTEEELSGLLNKVLPLIQKLQETGFSQVKTIEETRAQYKRLSNSVFSFSEHVLEDLDGWIDAEVIYNAYLKHCSAIRSIARSRELFFKELRRFCTYIYPSRRRVGGVQTPGYAGMKLDEIEPVLAVQGVQGQNPSNMGFQRQLMGENLPCTLSTPNTIKEEKIAKNAEKEEKGLLIRDALLHLLTKGHQAPDQLYNALKSTFPALETLTLSEFERIITQMLEKGEIYNVSAGVLAKV